MKRNVRELNLRGFTYKRNMKKAKYLLDKLKKTDEETSTAKTNKDHKETRIT